MGAERGCTSQNSNMNKIVKIALLLSGLGLFSCASRQQAGQTHFPKADGRYDSEFPVESVSDELAYLSTTVRKLNCLVFYRTYSFDAGNPLEKTSLTQEQINTYASGSEVTNESVSGTATMVYYDGKQLGMLTCAHVVDFTDSLFTYYTDGSLQSLSVKLNQQNFVSGLPDGEDIELIASDDKKDIALLRKVLSSHEQRPAVLKYPIGNTKDLDWGTVVYTMGYPLGKLMVTRAIVSKPENGNKGMFLTDALFNQGISGSPVLALRDGVPNFEWVGMASSSSAQSIHYLSPGDDNPQEITTSGTYSGEVYLDHRKAIHYGVTFSVRIEDVVKFLSQNKKLLQEKGFHTDRFFK